VRDRSSAGAALGEPVLGIDVAYINLLIVVVAVAGEIDMDTAAQLQATLMATIEAQPPRTLTIDLAGVSLLDAAGMTALIQVHQHARRQHIETSLINAQPLVSRSIRITGLGPFFGLPG
jgi:anti-anti-sigma factor